MGVIKTVRRQLIGAGIVPFQVTNGNQVVFYLAREKHVRQWRGSLKWSGFEGGARMGESAIETADREFYEETIGAHHNSNVSDELRRRDYALEIITSHPNHQQYVTYVKRFENFEKTVRRFALIRASVEGAHALTRQLDGLRRGAKAADAETPPSIHDESPDDMGLRVLNLRARRHALVQKIQEHCPMCIEVSYAKDGLIDEYHIDECFVEKDAVQPWTLAEIARVLRSGLAEKVFRHSFIPILHVLQREFQ